MQSISCDGAGLQIRQNCTVRENKRRMHFLRGQGKVGRGGGGFVMGQARLGGIQKSGN